MAPQEVPPQTAMCNQNIVEGDAIDIRMFPAQRMWPLDGGRYLGTADAVVTRCPQTGRVNVGTYRHIKNYSRRTKLSKAAYHKVAARWQEFGLPGEPPAVTMFEDGEFPEQIA